MGTLYLVAFLGLACGRGDADSNILTIVAETPAQRIDIGLGDDTALVEIFAEIVGVQADEANDVVVVLGSFPPHVRVFNLQGKLQAAFGAAGDGPGELRRPHALAVKEGTVLVVDEHGASLFSLNGKLIAEARNLGFIPQSATRGCGEDWVIFGPGSGAEDEKTTWLHAITFNGDSVRKRTLFADTSKWSGSVVRRARVVAWDGRGVVAFHQDADPPLTLRFTCPDYAVEVLGTHPELAGRGMRISRSSEDGTQIALTANSRAWFRGITGMNGRALLQRGSHRDGRVQSTLLLESAQQPTDSLELHSAEKLVFIGRRLLLVTSEDPVPHITVTTPDKLISEFSAGE